MPTPLPPVQYIVLHDFRPHGWGMVEGMFTSLDDVAEAMVRDALHDLSNVSLWRVDKLCRDFWDCVPHTDVAYFAALRLIAARTPDPRDLPEWHPDYPETEPAWPKSLSDLVGGHI